MQAMCVFSWPHSLASRPAARLSRRPKERGTGWTRRASWWAAGPHIEKSPAHEEDALDAVRKGTQWQQVWDIEAEHLATVSLAPAGPHLPTEQPQPRLLAAAPGLPTAARVPEPPQVGAPLLVKVRAKDLGLASASHMLLAVWCTPAMFFEEVCKAFLRKASVWRAVLLSVLGGATGGLVDAVALGSPAAGLWAVLSRTTV